jgi:hypothetical protein
MNDNLTTILLLPGSAARRAVRAQISAHSGSFPLSSFWQNFSKITAEQFGFVVKLHPHIPQIDWEITITDQHLWLMFLMKNG